LYIVGQAVQLTTILKQAAQIGLEPKFVWTVAGSINPLALKLAEGKLEGVITADNYVPTLDSPANKAFIAALEKRFPGEVPQFYQTLGYDAITVIAMSMQAAGTADDWQKIAEAMHRLSYDSPRGRLTFDEKGQVKLDVFLVKIQNGQPTVLK
jgi:branched-chain amino acid transport system substrate-binding protein